MVDVAIDILGKAFWYVTVELLRKHTIDSIEAGDIQLDMIRNQLMNDIEKVQEGIDAIRYKDYHASVSLFKSALNAMKAGIDEQEIKNYFRNSDLDARRAFGSVAKFEDKATITRIRIMSTMYLHGYFNDNRTLSQTQFILDECTEIFQQLLDTAVVASTLREEYGSKTLLSKMLGNGNKEDRLNILRELSQIKSVLHTYLNYQKALTYADNDQKWSIKPYIESVCLIGHANWVTSLVIFNNVLYSGSGDNTVRAWDINTRKELFQLVGHTAGVVSLAVCDGVLYSGSWDKTIRAWDLNTHKELFQLVGHSGYVWSLASWGSIVYSGAADTIRAWDINTRTSMFQLQGHSSHIISLIVSDGVLYSGSWDKTIRAWDLNTQKELYQLNGHTGGIVSLVVHNGVLYSGSWDRTIRAWDLNTHKELYQLNGHTGGVGTLAVHNNKLFSGSSDRTIRAWDLNTRAELYQLRQHTEAISSIVFNSNVLYSGSWDKTIKEFHEW